MSTIHLLGGGLSPLGDKKRSRELPTLADEKQKLYALLAKAKPDLPVNFFPTLDRVVPMFYWAMGKKDWLKVHQFMKTFFPDLKAIPTVDVKKWTKADAVYWIEMGCSLRCPILEEENLQHILDALDKNNLSQTPFNLTTFDSIREKFSFVRMSCKALELDLARYRVFLAYKASFPKPVAALPSPESSLQTVPHKKVKLEGGAQKLDDSDVLDPSNKLRVVDARLTKTVPVDLRQKPPVFPSDLPLELEDASAELAYCDFLDQPNKPLAPDLRLTEPYPFDLPYESPLFPNAWEIDLEYKHVELASPAFLDPATTPLVTDPQLTDPYLFSKLQHPSPSPVDLAEELDKLLAAQATPYMPAPADELPSLISRDSPNPALSPFCDFEKEFDGKPTL